MRGIPGTISAPLTSAIHSLAKAVGMDRAIGYTLLNYGITGLSLPVSLYLVARYINPVVQGFYFTFSSILALQVVFELGFSQCIMQFASHEFAHLSFLGNNTLIGDKVAVSRVSSLMRLAIKWYLMASVVAFCAVGIGGYWFFSFRNSGDINWIKPWLVVCSAMAMNLTIIPFFSIIEGCNRIPLAAAIRCAGSLARCLVVCLALASGLQLYALGLSVMTYFLICGAGILYWFHPLFQQLLSVVGDDKLNWRREIWPFQWKIAISWISGYLVFQLFTPVLFRFHGAVSAGQFGMTFALIQGAGSVATAWGATKIPRYGILIKRKEFEKLDALWRGATIKSVIIAGLGGLLLVAGTCLLGRYPRVGSRLLEPIPTLYLAIATVLNQIVFAQAFYLRAHKREPFLALSVGGGLATALLVVWAGREYSALGVSLSYLAVILCILPWAQAIFVRCRHNWHRAVPAAS
jgi:hypothetical protein